MTFEIAASQTTRRQRNHTNSNDKPGLFAALFALGIALIVRSTAAAIAVLVLWPLLIESVIGALLSLVSADTVAE